MSPVRQMSIHLASLEAIRCDVDTVRAFLDGMAVASATDAGKGIRDYARALGEVAWSLGEEMERMAEVLATEGHEEEGDDDDDDW